MLLAGWMRLKNRMAVVTLASYSGVHVSECRMISKSPQPLMPAHYSDRFQEPESVANYETKEYGPGSYASFIWDLQRPVLEKILADFRQTQSGPVRLLDFACGTGRVISCLEPLVDEAEGIDISENMVAVARGKCRAGLPASWRYFGAAGIAAETL